MDELNAMQYATLDAIGIPVWIRGSNTSIESRVSLQNTKQQAPAAPVTNAAGALALPLLGKVDAPLLFVGENLALDGATPSARILLALLSALALSLENVAILPWQSAYLTPLKTHLKTAGITRIVLLGEQVSQDCFEQQSMEVLRGQKQQFSGIDTWVSHHPDDLCKQPINKAVAWQDLRGVSA